MLVDRVDNGSAIGRLPWQADDVDGITVVEEAATPGEFLDVAVEEVVDDYDFRASLVARRPVEAPPAIRRAVRSLPLAVTVGSYGR